MTLDYTACHFEVTPLQPASDLLIAELGSLGFESFEETPTGVIAYINTSFWSPDLLEGLAVYDYDGFSFSYTINLILPVCKSPATNGHIGMLLKFGLGVCKKSKYSNNLFIICS